MTEKAPTGAPKIPDAPNFESVRDKGSLDKYVKDLFAHLSGPGKSTATQYAEFARAYQALKAKDEVTTAEIDALKNKLPAAPKVKAAAKKAKTAKKTTGELFLGEDDGTKTVKDGKPVESGGSAEDIERANKIEQPLLQLQGFINEIRIETGLNLFEAQKKSDHLTKFYGKLRALKNRVAKLRRGEKVSDAEIQKHSIELRDEFRAFKAEVGSGKFGKKMKTLVLGEEDRVDGKSVEDKKTADVKLENPDAPWVKRADLKDAWEAKRDEYDELLKNRSFTQRVRGRYFGFKPKGYEKLKDELNSTKAAYATSLKGALEERANKQSRKDDKIRVGDYEKKSLDRISMVDQKYKPWFTQRYIVDDARRRQEANRKLLSEEQKHVAEGLRDRLKLRQVGAHLKKHKWTYRIGSIAAATGIAATGGLLMGAGLTGAAIAGFGAGSQRAGKMMFTIGSGMFSGAVVHRFFDSHVGIRKDNLIELDQGVRTHSYDATLSDMDKLTDDYEKTYDELVKARQRRKGAAVAAAVGGGLLGMSSFDKVDDALDKICDFDSIDPDIVPRGGVDRPSVVPEGGDTFVPETPGDGVPETETDFDLSGQMPDNLPTVDTTPIPRPEAMTPAPEAPAVPHHTYEEPAYGAGPFSRMSAETPIQPNPEHSYDKPWYGGGPYGEHPMESPRPVPRPGEMGPGGTPPEAMASLKGPQNLPERDYGQGPGGIPPEQTSTASKVPQDLPIPDTGTGEGIGGVTPEAKMSNVMRPGGSGVGGTVETPPVSDFPSRPVGPVSDNGPELRGDLGSIFQPTENPNVFYVAERCDNFWDILEGDTDAPRPSVMLEIDPRHEQALIDLTRDHINELSQADRSAIGFGGTASELQIGANVDIGKIDEIAREISIEEGWITGESSAPSSDSGVVLEPQLEVGRIDLPEQIYDPSGQGVTYGLLEHYPEYFPPAGSNDWRPVIDLIKTHPEWLKDANFVGADLDAPGDAARLDILAEHYINHQQGLSFIPRGELIEAGTPGAANTPEAPEANTGPGADAPTSEAPAAEAIRVPTELPTTVYDKATDGPGVSYGLVKHFPDQVPPTGSQDWLKFIDVFNNQHPEWLAEAGITSGDIANPGPGDQVRLDILAEHWANDVTGEGIQIVEVTNPVADAAAVGVETPPAAANVNVEVPPEITALNKPDIAREYVGRIDAIEAVGNELTEADRAILLQNIVGRETMYEGINKALDLPEGNGLSRLGEVQSNVVKEALENGTITDLLSSNDIPIRGGLIEILQVLNEQTPLLENSGPMALNQTIEIGVEQGLIDFNPDLGMIDITRPGSGIPFVGPTAETFKIQLNSERLVA